MLDKTMKGLRSVTLTISAVAILLMAILEIAEIFSRSFFSHSFLIVDEFAGYFMACMVFMGLSNSYAAGSFVRVEIFYGLLRGKAQRVVNLVHSALLLVFTGVFGYYSVLLNWKSFSMGLVSTGFYRTPLAYPQIFMSVGVVCFFLYILLDIIRQIKGVNEP